MEQKRKKVLIITYYWPPGSGPGVQRFLKMSGFLYDFGWEPVILTVKNGSYPSTDSSLVNEIPEALRVYKTKTLEPFAIFNLLSGKKGKQVGVGMIGLQDKKNTVKRISLHIRANLFLPDARRGWVPFAFKKAKKLHKKLNFDAVVTTGPPHSSHIIGYKLKKCIGIPWLADMRDPWVNNFFNAALPRTKFAKQIEQKFENKIIKNADFVTVVSPGLKEEFEDRNNNIGVVYNGFDQEDIPEIENYQSKRFSLSYIGNFKPNQNIDALWQAIRELCEEIPGFKEHFNISLTGNVDSVIKKRLEEKDLFRISTIQPFVPHREATKLMNQSHLLLFIVPKAKGNRLIITGKLFEYIAIRSPILSIGPLDGDASKILSQAGRDPMIDYSDKEKIKTQISAYYKKWLEQEKYNFKHSSSDLKKFSRYASAENLAKILKTIGT